MMRRLRSALDRLRFRSPQSREEHETVAAVATGEQQLQRNQHPLDRGLGPRDVLDFMKGVPVFTDAAQALAVNGWKLMPPGVGPREEAGMYGVVKLVHKVPRSSRRQPLRVNCLAAAKQQPMSNWRLAWREANILSAFDHENIVKMHEMFVEDTSKQPDFVDFPSTIWLLMEYASAGSLKKEMSRYPDERMPETGVRYYCLQIAAGLKYVHSRNVAHNDVHWGNVVLKYRPDCSKVAMLCDFGLSITFGENADPAGDGEFQKDISRFCHMIANLLGPAPAVMEHSLREIYAISSVHRVTYQRAPETMDLLLQFTWFNGPAKAPHPPNRGPTPLLKTPDYPVIGYKRQDTLTGLEPPVLRSSLLNSMRKGLRNMGRRVSGAVQSVGRSKSLTPSYGAIDAGSDGGSQAGQAVTSAIEVADEVVEQPTDASVAATASDHRRHRRRVSTRISSLFMRKRQ